MKKIFCLAVVLLFLVACGPKSVPDYEIEEDLEPETVTEEVVVEEEAPVDEPPAEVGRKPPAYTPPSEKVVEQTKPAEVVEKKEAADPELHGLLNLPDEKVKSYSFLYGGPETNYAFEDTYIIKGDDIKVHKYEEDYYVMANETTQSRPRLCGLTESTRQHPQAVIRASLLVTVLSYSCLHSLASQSVELGQGTSRDGVVCHEP